ncbi:MAG: hypothetical protein ACRD5Z_02205, partial [Bryobacteraceae bacterium]
PEDEAELRRSLHDLKTQVEKQEEVLWRLLTIGPPDMAQNCRARYQENGSWARHYSTVRVTVATFLVPVSLGILAFSWKPPQHPPLIFVALSGVMWSIAVILFLSFTRQTYGEMERAREKRTRMPDRAGDSQGEGKQIHPRRDIASWVLALLTIAFGLLLLNVGGISLAASPTMAFHGAIVDALACYVPAFLILLGVIAIVVTVVQPQPK